MTPHLSTASAGAVSPSSPDSIGVSPVYLPSQSPYHQIPSSSSPLH